LKYGKQPGQLTAIRGCRVFKQGVQQFVLKIFHQGALGGGREKGLWEIRSDLL